MDKNLKILEVEDKKTKAGKNYLRVKTDPDGWISCFDGKTNKEIKENIGKELILNVIEQGDFKNIKGIGKKVDVKTEKVSNGAENSSKQATKPFEKDPVGLAVDCFCSIVSRISQADFDNRTDEERLALMNLAIEAVKKAEKAFK